jgi:hypothetical protein
MRMQKQQTGLLLCFYDGNSQPFLSVETSSFGYGRLADYRLAIRSAMIHHEIPFAHNVQASILTGCDMGVSLFFGNVWCQLACQQ